MGNAATIAAYVLCDLATHPEYLSRVREELNVFVSSFNSDECLLLVTR
jgi:hypothetical protein